MLTIRIEKPSDAAAREALLDLAYGTVRFQKPSERLRAKRDASAPSRCRGSGAPDRPRAAQAAAPHKPGRS